MSHTFMFLLTGVVSLCIGLLIGYYRAVSANNGSLEIFTDENGLTKVELKIKTDFEKLLKKDHIVVKVKNSLKPIEYAPDDSQ